MSHVVTLNNAVQDLWTLDVIKQVIVVNTSSVALLAPQFQDRWHGIITLLMSSALMRSTSNY